MNKAPNTSKQYLLARQTVFGRHYKQTYSCQIGRRQTVYIEYILKCLFIWQCRGIHICNFAYTVFISIDITNTSIGNIIQG